MALARTPVDPLLNQALNPGDVFDASPIDEENVALEQEIGELPPEYELLEAVGEGGWVPYSKHNTE